MKSEFAICTTTLKKENHELTMINQ